MNKKVSFLISAAAVAGISFKASAQYPVIPPAVQAVADSVLAQEERSSDEAWAKAWPIVEAEAKAGKPYVPWANKPSDLKQAKIAAFPGAEGGGKFSFGGRGGKVLVVTSLEDRGPGTLRWACEQGGARIIVFNVAGIIKLKTPIIVRAPYVTIAGQTAPGDGVCVAGESVWLDTHDVVVRYMRFRRGATDVARRDDALGGNVVGNIMIDHVSASWGLDENMSIYRHVYDDGKEYKKAKLATVNITIQNSVFSEGLDAYNHAFGSTIGGLNSTFVRNLWADNISRNPSVGMYGDFNFVNNVVFNWWNRSADGGDNNSLYNFINNYYKPGPITPAGEPISYRILKPESGRSKEAKDLFGKVYVHGNIIEGNERVTKNNWDGGIQPEPSRPEMKDSLLKALKSDKPFPMPVFKILPTLAARDYVLANVGATLPKRDAVDERIIKQVRTGVIENKPLPDAIFHVGDKYIKRRLPEDSYKQGIITHPSQVGGYPEYKGTPYKDSDNDGMPDAYEIKHGLNPHDASDAAKYTKSGYTNIEVYLNSVVPLKNVKAI